MNEDVEALSTAENYARWHDHLEERTQTTPTPRRGVLISELLGPDDGPHDDKWRPNES